MGRDPARQAYLTHFQVSMRGDPGEITVFLKDFADAQVGKHLLQVGVTGDGQSGHKHICDPREEKVTKVNSGALPFSRQALGLMVMRHLSSQPLRSQNFSLSTE